MKRLPYTGANATRCCATENSQPVLMVVRLRESETARRRGFGVELDQHRRLVTHDPRVVSRFHDDHLRCDELEGAAVSIRTLDVAAGQEADVRMHAEGRADERLQVRGPAEARRIDEALHAAVRSPDAVDGDAAQLLVSGAFDRGKQCIHGLLPYITDRHKPG